MGRMICCTLRKGSNKFFLNRSHEHYSIFISNLIMLFSAMLAITIANNIMAVKIIETSVIRVPVFKLYGNERIVIL